MDKAGVEEGCLNVWHCADAEPVSGFPNAGSPAKNGRERWRHHRQRGVYVLTKAGTRWGNRIGPKPNYVQEGADMTSHRNGNGAKVVGI